jgi:hypothetical protein
MQMTFNDLINKIRNLSLDEKIEIKEIIEKSIIDERRKEIQKHYLESKKEYNNGKLQFSRNISKLKKMIG